MLSAVVGTSDTQLSSDYLGSMDETKLKRELKGLFYQVCLAKVYSTLDHPLI
jgi:hypothetical protein